MSNLKLGIGVGLLLALILVAAGGPLAVDFLFPEQNPLRTGEYDPLQSPGSPHWIGTDLWGRDALAVLLHSIWQSFLLGLVSGVLATAIGVVIGFVAGYAGGRTDGVLRTITDMFLVVPTIPILLSLTLYIPRWNILSVGILLGAFSWPFAARVIRAQVLSLRRRSYIDLAKLSGESPLEIIFLELLPALAPFLALGLFSAVVASMLAEAGLQLIGIGAGRLSTLGNMIGEGFRFGYLSIGLYAQIILPALVLVLMFLSLQLINMGLEEAFNPRLQTRIRTDRS